MNVNNRTLFIADNLDIMRGMDSNTIDLIYLDPPFNTKKQYKAPIGSPAEGAEFKDIWTDEDVKAEWHGHIAEHYENLYKVIQATEFIYDKSMKIYLMAMAIRLFEMQRLLKDTGSIYLHCDPTASHYLKLIMDDIFGKNNFRNEIVWQRFSAHNDAKNGFAKVHDILLFYTTSHLTKFNKTYEPYGNEYIQKAYRYKDERGRYTTSPLQARSLSGGGYSYTYKGIQDIWKFPLDKLKELDRTGDIHWPKKGKIPRRKVYLDTAKGIPVRDIVTDIKPLTSAHKERTGYPTQKPLALLRRIISASSNENDLILDPFCGCATACVAAEELQRQWIGIDISPSAEDITKLRLEEASEQGKLFSPIQMSDVTVTSTPPIRTDIPKQPKPHTYKYELYGEQNGICNGCQIHFPYRNLTIDHIVSRHDDGTDHKDNLQLLCQACNSVKGTGTQEELIQKLKDDGITS